MNQLNKVIYKLHEENHEIIEKLLEQYFVSDFEKDIVPLFFDDYLNIKEEKILYIGLNPSLTKKNSNNLKSQKIDSFKYLKSKTDKYKSEIIDKLINQQNSLKYGNNTIDFFKSINDFNINLKKYDWIHYDLFHIRLTKQQYFIKIIESSKLENYKTSCIDLLKKIINSPKIKAIICLNSKTSIYLSKSLDLKLILEGGFRNKLYGLYEYDRKKVFLFKQLTGGGTTNPEKKSFKQFVSKNI